MIYRLNDEFTKIEETKGMMQNRSDKVEIEFITCKENPQKDSGGILRPMEKYDFAVEKGESVYARCNQMNGALATLAVVNFKKPASESGAGGDMVGDIKLRHILQPGYIKADGSLLNRAEYSALFEFAQENELLLTEADWANGMQGMYAEGDGVETFRVPDLRGQFLRCVDDGRIVGSMQGDAIRNITGKMVAREYSDKSYTDPAPTGCFISGSDTSSCVLNGSYRAPYLTGFDASRVVPTAEENRPKNIALIAQIKY